MLILFWPKSRLMCKNVQGWGTPTLTRGLKPTFLMTLPRGPKVLPCPNRSPRQAKTILGARRIWEMKSRGHLTLI